MDLTIENVVAAYLSQRRLKEDLEREHKEKLKPINERMKKAETWLLAALMRDNVQHAAVSAGTAYVKERTSCSVEDWEAFFTHMQQTENWEMLTQGASKKAVQEYLAREGKLPPGVKYSSENIVQVRTNSK